MRKLGMVETFGYLLAASLAILLILSASLPATPAKTQVGSFRKVGEAKSFILQQARQGWKVKTVTAIPRTSTDGVQVFGSEETWLVVLEK